MNKITPGKEHLYLSLGFPEMAQSTLAALDRGMATLRIDRCAPPVISLATGRESLNETKANLY